MFFVGLLAYDPWHQPTRFASGGAGTFVQLRRRQLPAAMRLSLEFIGSDRGALQSRLGRSRR